jgi:hypothetical protein
MPEPCETPSPAGTGRRDRRRRLAHAVARRVAVAMVVACVAPFVTYLVVRPNVESTALALAISFAVPVAWAGFSAMWHWRLDLDGALTIGAYGLALVVTVLSGGSALPLKLHSAAETGAAGVACIVSVVLRRPVVLLGLRLIARRSGSRRPGAWQKIFAKPALGRTFSTLTLIAGAVLLVDSASQVALALELPTVLFIAVSLPARFGIYACGAGLFLALRGRGGQPLLAPLNSSRRRWTGRAR